MKINNLAYLLKEGVKNIFVHRFASFAAVCITVACLLIVGSFASIMYNVNIMVEKLDKTNNIIAYIDEELSEAEARSITTQINMVENVMSTEFRTREQALEDFIANNGDEEVFEGLEADTFRHRIVVVLEDNAYMKDTVDEIKAIAGVAEITAYYELAETFAMVRDVLQGMTTIVTIVLLGVSLLIISNTVRIAMYDRREEIAIMKMVGATNGFIRLPFVVEGFLLGMIGAGASFGLEWVLYDYIVDSLGNLDPEFDVFNFVPFQELLGPMMMVFLACGLFVGVVGSWTSIQRFMRK